MDSNFDIYFNDEALTDINPLFIGREKCERNHSFGPRICPYTIIHYVVSGKGTLEYNNEKYSVHEGQFFVIFEGEPAKYYADDKDPWDYFWIAYDGIYMNQMKILKQYVFNADVNAFNKLLNLCINENINKYAVTSLLYEIHGANQSLIRTSPSHNYPDEAKRIIKLKYMQSISITEIAKMLSIDKRYLSRIFKEKYGKTLISYLIEVRIKKACELLKEGYSVADSSLMVGYTDAFNFSKMFNKVMGMSPRQYKNTHLLK